MITIADEALKNSSLSTDLDNFRYKYLDTDPTIGVSVQFPSLSIDTLDKNAFNLYSNAKRVPFLAQWEMRPDYVSYDLYNTVLYWYLILYMNHANSIEDFIGYDTILVVPYQYLLSLVRDRITDPPIPLEDTNPYNENEISHYLKYPLGNLAQQEQKAAANLNPTAPSQIYDIITNQQTNVFVLTNTDITNKYVILTQPPANTSSIVLTINNLGIQQYMGLDFTLTMNTDNKNTKITWDPSKLVAGSLGMGPLLSSGDIITVKYVTLNQIKV